MNWAYWNASEKLRKKRTAERQARILLLLEMLPPGRDPTYQEKQEYAEKIGVDIRTIYTYLKVIRDEKKICPCCKRKLD